MTTTPPPPQAPASAPAPFAAPPRATSIVNKMMTDALTSPPARIVAAVLAALVVAAVIVGGIADGRAGAINVLTFSISLLVVGGLGIFVLAAIVLWVIAARRARGAESDLMQSYAGSRGLTYAASGKLPATTPLLSAGSRRRTEDIITGMLPGGIHGMLAHYTYSVSRGRGSSFHSNTVVLARLQETTAYARRLLCHDGLLLGKTGFSINFSDRQVELESADLNRRYDIRTSQGQDEVWLRELFTLEFIDWLAHRARFRFSFELVDGLLVVALPERLNRAYDLDWLCRAATYVGGRVRGEALEDNAAPVSSQGPGADE